MSQTNRSFDPVPRKKRRMVDGSITRAGSLPPPGALATPISASVCAAM
jgi:hypothetical protein